MEGPGDCPSSGFFEKIRNFSALDERDCQAAWLFAHWGQFGRETRAWPDGADPTRFHMHIGKIGQFLEVWVFRGTQVEFCHPGAAKAAKKHASLKIWPTARKRQKITKNLKKSVKNEKKIFLRKSAIFRPLMRGTAKQHGFLHIGANLVAKRALGQMGQIHPISTCI